MGLALVVVDVQNDFCEGGSLAVEGGNRVAEGIRKHIDLFESEYEYIAFTKDFHLAPPNTNGGHFSDTPDYVNSWPVHCVQGTNGAVLHPDIQSAISLTLGNSNKWGIFHKGEGRADYSGFQGKSPWGKPLVAVLNTRGIKELDICGIAGDFCVKATAADATMLGYGVNILPHLVASVGGVTATEDLASTYNL